MTSLGKGQRRLRGMGGMPRGEPPLSSATKQAMYQDQPALQRLEGDSCAYGSFRKMVNAR